MKISRYRRMFHDPWGSRYRRSVAGDTGTVVGCAYMVSRSDLNDHDEFDSHGRPINDYRHLIDRVTTRENNGGGYIKSKRPVEKLRR